MNKSKGERIFDQLQKLGFLSPNLDFPLFFSNFQSFLYMENQTLNELFLFCRKNIFLLLLSPPPQLLIAGWPVDQLRGEETNRQKKT